MRFVGQSYNGDSERLYTLLVQHVSTSGSVSNIIVKHKNAKKLKCCYFYLKDNFLTNSHDHTKAQRAENKISKATYSGGGGVNWKIEDYYNIMSK